MAYKVFSNGDALTGSELNTYLMNQSVMVFASTAARDAALTAPTEGMVVWLQDANKYVYYTGSAWSDLITPASSGNAIINGAFDIWQRGTSFNAIPSYDNLTADRWRVYNGVVSSTATVSQQTFTPGTAPVSGYEGTYFLRAALSGYTSGTFDISQRIEDVRTFAGQTVTISFWAKAAATTTLAFYLSQLMGTGGSGDSTVSFTPISVTTSWVRYTATATVGSLAGSTIGSGSSLAAIFRLTSNASLDIWGVQVEAGSVATPFKRNAPSIQAERATCQGFNYRVSADASTPYTYFGHATAGSSTTLRMPFYTKTSLRTFISSVEWGGSIIATTGNGSTYAITNIAIDAYSKEFPALVLTVASGLTTNTTYIIRADNSATAYIGLPAEL